MLSKKGVEMKGLLLVGSAVVAALVLALPALAGGKGPPGGTIYAFDQAYATIGVGNTLPDKGPTDTLYHFPDCATCAAVSDAAPGHPGYNGGRWKVVDAYGITSQLTNAADVEAAASMLVDTGTRTECPLIHT
jgi:hypothetical protein